MRIPTASFVSISRRNPVLRRISNKEVKRVEDALNNRPRKGLDFLTPNEAGGIGPPAFRP